MICLPRSADWFGRSALPRWLLTLYQELESL